MRGGFVLGLIGLVLTALVSAQEPEKKEETKGLVVVDKDGQETFLKKWRFSLGTRPLALHTEALKAPEKKGPPVKVPEGPLYLEFREDNSTTFKDGILTLVPIASVRKIDYDNDKKTVTVTYLQAGDKEATLTGTTKYVGINKLTVEGDADLGKLGFATVKYQGGLTTHPKAVKSFRFPPAQPAPEVSGSWSIITTVEKDKAQHKVQDLKALYKVAGGYRVSPTLIFKKTVKIDLPQIAHLRHVEGDDKKQVSPDFEVTLADGKQLILTLLFDTNPDDGTPAQFVGLLGKVPAGYKLFPPHTIGEMKAEK
jgi:hypothetical protein